MYLRWLVRDYSPSQFEENRVPFAMNVNIKVTKKLFGDRLHIAMFCNKLLDYTPRPGDVADPWYTGNFEATWQDVLLGCRCLLELLEEERVR
jgi:hypothetical protein